MVSSKTAILLLEKFYIPVITGIVLLCISFSVIGYKKPHLSVFKKYTDLKICGNEYSLWLIDFVNSGNSIAEKTCFKVSFKKNIIASNRESDSGKLNNNRNHNYTIGDLHSGKKDSYYYVFDRTNKLESKPVIDFYAKNVSKHKKDEYNVDTFTLFLGSRRNNKIFIVGILFVLVFFISGFYLLRILIKLQGNKKVSI
ncbi:MAG: hypothetical protein GY777_11710 [Candidatus Brocadiaceae bacterium]|nr:hypothetical protein [Candidatus Brocadiaceae bacterium]